MDCKHCWHETGFVLTSNPPQYPEVCCHCGEQRVIYGSPVQPQEGHGKYLPTQRVVSLPLYDYDTLPKCIGGSTTQED